MALWDDKSREPRVMCMDETLVEQLDNAIEQDRRLDEGTPLDQVSGQKPVDPDHGKTVVNSAGGKQSKLVFAVGSADPLAVLAMAKVQAEGDAKYGRDNWRLIPERDHLEHALAHITLHLAGDTDEAHLAHALTRVHMAMAKHLRPDYYGETEGR